MDLMPRRGSRAQSIRLRRAAMAAVASLLHLGMCWLAYLMGFMQLGLAGMLLLSAAVVLCHGTFLGLIALRLNLHFRDPGLTVPQMLWAIALIFASACYAGELRSVFLMLVVLVISVGAFRLGRRGFLGIGLFVMACYLGLLLALGPARLDWRLELISALEFTLLLGGVFLLGMGMSRMRLRLQERNHDLRQALERIQQMAIVDEQTGLYNRRFAQELLEQQKALADRGDYRFVVCLIDLDHFQQVNELYGRALGDQLLREVAGMIAAQVRDIDFVARQGGDEFLLLLSQTDEMGALHLLGRVRQSLASARFEGAEGVNLTFSAGVSGYRAEESSEDLLLRADEALCRAKYNGRDQVVTL